MRKSVNGLVLVLFVFLFSSASGMLNISGAQDAVASFASVGGSIEYKPEAAEKYSLVEADTALTMALNDGDIVRSYNDSTAEIKMNIGASIQLHGGTEMQVGHGNIRINRGGVWINYKARTGKGKVTFVVSTPAGTIGVKGTVFAVKYDETSGGVLVQVREGAVEFKPEGAGGPVEIKSDQLLIVEKNKSIRAPMAVKPDYDVLAAGGNDSSGSSGGDGKKEDYQNVSPLEKLMD